MPKLKIKFSDGSSQEFAYKGELIGIEVVKDELKFFINTNQTLKEKQEEFTVTVTAFNPLDKQHTLLGTWLTDQQFTVEIYDLDKSKTLWLARCKDCGEGKDKLIYDLDGKPVNYPEFGKVMNRLDQNDSFRRKI